jgi:predicted dinucleotide-binding enzyme
MGRALARLFARSGRPVRIASRDRARAEGIAGDLAGSLPGTGAGSVLPIELAGAASSVRRGSGLVALATVWQQTRDVIAAAGPFDGVVLLDATNPEAADGRNLALGHSTSGAETIARWAEGARVVKAFNHTYAELLDEGARFPSGGRAGVLYCGDDAEAKRRVAELVAACGFEPVDAGPLSSARYLEPVAALFVELVRGRGRPPADVAFSLLSRERGRPAGGILPAP